ncbi:hypothetical protein C0J52_11300 [Blattella germanica]|nr:hypothetical protein C0J52_11300 [Blattella germanica]
MFFNPPRLDYLFKTIEPDDVSHPQRIAVHRQLQNEARRIKDDKWFPTTEDETKAYFWLSKEACIETPIFGHTMSIERFLHLSHFLHFADINNKDEAHKLKKLRFLLTHFSKKNFTELYNLCQNIALDGSLMKYRGRLSYVQCNRSKRARFGIKIYKICALTHILGKITNVVIDICEPLFNKGHTLFIDNWYTSPDLCKIMLERGTNIVGTSINYILCVKWRDNKDVYFLSSKHERTDLTVSGKLKKKKDVLFTIKIRREVKQLGNVKSVKWLFICWSVLKFSTQSHRSRSSCPVSTNVY